MNALAVRAANTGKLDEVELNRVATGRARLQLLSDDISIANQGILVTGEPVLTPAVSSMSVAASPPAATVTDCVDATALTVVRRGTGEHVVTPDQARRYVVTSTLIRGDDQLWRVSERAPDRSRTC